MTESFAGVYGWAHYASVSGGRVEWAKFTKDFADKCENGGMHSHMTSDEARRVWDAQGYIEDDKVESQINERETRGYVIRLRQEEALERAGRDMSKHRLACPPQQSTDVY